MANRDDSSEPKESKRKRVKEAEVEEAREPYFPTSLHLARVKRAAGKVRPNVPYSLDELFDTVDEIRKERESL